MVEFVNKVECKMSLFHSGKLFLLKLLQKLLQVTPNIHIMISSIKFTQRTVYMRKNPVKHALAGLKSLVGADGIEPPTFAL